jgi:hypothetical protein
MIKVEPCPRMHILNVLRGGNFIYLFNLFIFFFFLTQWTFNFGLSLLIIILLNKNRLKNNTGPF